MPVLIISADQFEDVELLAPLYRLREAEVDVDVASLKPGAMKGKHGYEVQAALAVSELGDRHYDLLLLPGGGAPARLREDPDVLDVVRRFFAEERPVAAICHGPQILISAGVVEGRTATCYHRVAEELREAGARYLDRELVVDGHLITARGPDDLPAFNREVMRRLTPEQRERSPMRLV